jgi:YVTN family beta-propeller protein
VAFTPSGSYAYVVNNFVGTVSVISTATNTVSATVTDGDDPNGVAVTPNGSYAYVANTTGRMVCVIAVSPIASLAPFATTTTTYSGQLAVSGNTGAVTYTTTVASPNVAVSGSGAVTSSSATLVGTYTVSGTDSDTSADNGTWTFTLTVATAPTVTGVAPTHSSTNLAVHRRVRGDAAGCRGHESVDEPVGFGGGGRYFWQESRRRDISGASHSPGMKVRRARCIIFGLVETFVTSAR